MSGLPPPGIRHVCTTLPVAKLMHARSSPRARLVDVEEARVAARVEPVRADAGRDEAEHSERCAVDHPDAAAVMSAT